MMNRQTSDHEQPQLGAAKASLIQMCLLSGMFLAVGQASAHVVYTSPLNEVGNQDNYVSSNAGWLGGLNATTQMDSHNNRFFFFELTQTSTVDFTISAISGYQYVPFGTTTVVTALSDLNPGYSLFSGLIPNISHDGSPYPGQTPFAPWSLFAVPHNPPVPGEVLGDPNSTKWGEYRSNADFTMSNDSGDVATVSYLAGDGNPNGNSISGHYVLSPGLYNLVIGGDNQAALDSLYANAVASQSCAIAGPACDAYAADRIGRGFNVQFSASPVPVPAAAYLFGSSLVGLVGLARRKRKSSV